MVLKGEQTFQMSFGKIAKLMFKGGGKVCRGSELESRHQQYLQSIYFLLRGKKKRRK